MYLYKGSFGVYYCRICMPTNLQKKGYPFDVRFSLQTKERPVAIARNLSVAAIVKQHLYSHQSLEFDAFYHQLRTHVDECLRGLVRRVASSDSEHTAGKYETTFPRVYSKKSVASLDPVGASLDWRVALEEFIESKREQGVTELTCVQLNTRCCAFFVQMEIAHFSEITLSVMMSYCRWLNRAKGTPKTCKDYYASIGQFLRWAVVMKYIDGNPLENVKPKFKKVKSAYQERKRWEERELHLLLSHPVFAQAPLKVKWVTYLTLYQGMRPGEACQLRVQDIAIKDGIYSISITDNGEKQRVKNAQSVRVVPLHNHLIERGFLRYVELRRQQGHCQLFDYKPTGRNQDWSRSYSNHFAKLLTGAGFTAGDRPTAYSLRHTFIDVLKKADVAEHLVAEVVGHTHEKMTFGRYGKKSSLANLQGVVNTFQIQTGGEA